MNKLYLLLLLAFIPFVSAIDEEQVPTLVKQSTVYNMNVPCGLGGWFCPSTTMCNVSIYYPNSTALINNKGMNQQGSGFNFTLTGGQTAQLGRYPANVKCSDPTSGLNGSTDLLLLITPNGEFDVSIGYFVMLGVALFFTLGLIIFGFSKQDQYVVLLGSLGLTLVGLYILINGISIYKNTITEPVGYIITFLAAYIGVRTGWETIQDP